MNIYGLLGNYLHHSFSASYFDLKFKEQNLKSHKYINWATSYLKNFRYLSILMNFKGLNVTIPYKKEVIKHIDYLDPLASRIKAVNTICFTKKNTHRV